MDDAAVELGFVHVGNGGLRLGLGEVEDVGSAAIGAGCIRWGQNKVGEVSCPIGHLHTLLTGRSKSSISPYWPNIS